MRIYGPSCVENNCTLAALWQLTQACLDNAYPLSLVLNHGFFLVDGRYTEGTVTDVKEIANSLDCRRLRSDTRRWSFGLQSPYPGNACRGGRERQENEQLDPRGWVVFTLFGPRRALPISENILEKLLGRSVSVARGDDTYWTSPLAWWVGQVAGIRDGCDPDVYTKVSCSDLMLSY